jgi:hypothetical protein
MIGDLLEALGEGIVVGKGEPSRRAQVLFRLFFGLLGTGLAAAGGIHFSSASELTSNVAMRLSMVVLFGALGCFCLFNVALLRTWRWPGRLFLISLAALFATRILFGP